MVALVLVLCLSVLPVALVSTYLVWNTRQELENTARQTVDFYTEQFSGRVESVLKSLNGNLFLLTTDDAILAAMRDEERRSYSGVEENAARILSGAGWGQDSVTGLFIFKDEARYIPILRGSIYSGATRRAQTAYGAFRGVNSARLLQYTAELPGYCYIVTNYLDLNSMQPLGKIVIEVELSSLLNDGYLQQVYENAQLVLSDLSGQVLQGDEASPLVRAAAGESLPSGGFAEVEGEGYYHVSRRLGHYNLQLDVFLPEREIFAAIDSTVRLYVVVAAVVLLGTVLVALSIYAHIARPLRNMTDTIGKVAGGNLNVQMPETPYRETERISTAFNSMTEHLKDLFDEVYQSGLYLRDAEYKSLEAQINPHFIFNVLEVINMRAMAAGQEDICRMVKGLGELLRSNLSHRDQQKIRLGEELEYVNYYLELQKQRFEDNLHYNIQLEDDELLAYYLPKLTLQPVVENSVVHGLENKRGGGRVQVRIWEEEDSVYLRVSDDGVGFDPTLAALDAPPAEGGPHNHVALYNIHRRIQLLYGEGYGLTIQSAPGAGSDVTIVLPVDLRPDKPQGAVGAQPDLTRKDEA